MSIDYKKKYLKYKKKYFELKNNFFHKGDIVNYFDKISNKYLTVKIININKEDPLIYFYEIKLPNNTIRNTLFNKLKN